MASHDLDLAIEDIHHAKGYIDRVEREAELTDREAELIESTNESLSEAVRALNEVLG